MVERLCRRYPAYTPETAMQADVSVLRHLMILDLAGVLGEGRTAEPGAVTGTAGAAGKAPVAGDGFWD